MDSNEGFRARKNSLRQLEMRRRKKEEEGEHKLMEEEEEEEEPLSPASCILSEKDFNIGMIGMIGMGKRVDVSVVKEGLEHSLMKHPRFSSIPVINRNGERKWVPTKVDVEDHIVVPEVESESEFPDKFVEDYVSGLSKSSLDTSKPLWELHVLNLKTSEAEAVVVLRLHHSLGDGVSLMSLFLACTRKTADPDSLPTIPSSGKVVLKESGVLSFLVFIWVFLKMFWNTIVDVLLFIATMAFLKDTDTPIKGSRGVEFRQKRFVHRTMELKDLKILKTVTKSTINDVLLGITSAGLTRYLNSRFGKTKGNASLNEKKTVISPNTRLRATILFNIRPTPGLHALAEMMEKGRSDARWGNKLGYVILPFSVGEQDNPLTYIHEAKAIANRKKSSFEAMFTFMSATLFSKTIGSKVAASLSKRVLSHTTFSFSNVVGPIEEVEFFGHPIAYIAPSVYGNPQALTIHFQSYANKVKLVVAVDESTIPDPHHLCEELTNSLQRMLSATEKPIS